MGGLDLAAALQDRFGQSVALAVDIAPETGFHRGDCRDWLRSLRPASIDAIVTDPPYGIGFMGKEWDGGAAFVERKAAKRNRFDHVGGNHNPTDAADAARTRHVEAARFQVWFEEVAVEMLRVLKPGGHLLCFGGTRTYHRATCAIEDAGFEIRDSIAAWGYSSGFPKSHDISKAIDKLSGAERPADDDALGAGSSNTASLGKFNSEYDATAPATPEAAEWEGWGTALAPAWEPIIVARKPPVGTVAANVLAHRTGGLNIDACRIAAVSGDREDYGLDNGPSGGFTGGTYGEWSASRTPYRRPAGGRWPKNVVFCHHPACVDGGVCGRGCHVAALGDEASRFFPTFRYEPKAPTRERPSYVDEGGQRVAHPTVKPLALMRWLVRMVTPPGGIVVDPFLGSGATAEAAALEGFAWAGAEMTSDYWPLIEQRLARTEGGR